MTTQPANYRPRQPGDFIGPAARLASVLERKARHARETGNALKLLLRGEPGTGKTSLVNMVSDILAGHKTQVESINGRNVTIEAVRRWGDSLPYRSLHAGFRVIIVNEFDTIPGAAQDALLSLLDDLPDNWAFLATSNARLDQITDRLQTRLQQFTVSLPSEAEIAGLLERFGCNGQSGRIAAGCKGNVRAALLDAQSVLDCAN